jgi:tetrahydromethanopterin S-methyltransferase subunit B
MRKPETAVRTVNWRRAIRWTALLLAACMILPSLGCSHFTPSTSANLAPFAEQTLAMAGSFEHSLGQGRLVYARHLAQGPETARYKESLAELQGHVRGIVAYSLQVVTVAESGLPADEKAKELAGFLDALIDRIDPDADVRSGLSEESIRAIIESVRSQESLMDALREAQPLVDEAGAATLAIMDGLRDSGAAAEAEIAGEIQKRHGAMGRYADIFKRQQAEVLEGLTLVDNYWKGDDLALEPLRESAPRFMADVPPAGRMTAEDVRSLEQQLFERLQELDKARQSMVYDVDIYFEQMRELDRISQSGDAALRKARVAVHLWVKTHRRLSRGITQPATFDLFEITESLIGTVL